MFKKLASLRGHDRVHSPHLVWLVLAVFVLVSGVIGVVATILGGRIQDGIRDQGRSGAEAAADAFVASHFDPSDFRDGRPTPAAAAELTESVGQSQSIEAMRLWSADHRLVYVSHASMRLRRASQPSEEFLAARQGVTQSDITSLAEEEASTAGTAAPSHETLIEVYRPIRLGDDGIPYVLETYVPYRYVESRVSEELRSLYFLLGAAALLINLALFPTLRRTARALQASAERRHAGLRRKLRRAMERDELVLHYQPIVDLSAVDIVGAEALVRWRQDDGSLLAPGAFLPQAEETDVIGPLALHVSQLAFEQCARWRAAGLELPVSVNLSARNLGDPALPDELSRLARSHDVPPSMVTLEVTETATMSDPLEAVEQLTRLYMHGFRLSIDDFGAGESSLSRLDQIPFSELKIDRSLISPLESAHNPTLVKTIVTLAHQLGMTVVAEGVEQEHTPSLLRGFGCDMAQGYLFSRPVEPQQLASLVLRVRAADRRREREIVPA